MPLLVEQLIYTSFPQIGFKCLVSEQVPFSVKQAFSEQIVHAHWDTYNPPEIGHQAVYLYQLSFSQILFGWLYNDGTDEFGRSNIPYFICYYLGETLNTFLLDKIFTCLETGPVNFLDRRIPPRSLENLLIPDFCLYEAPRRGIIIPSDFRQQSHNHLKQKTLINLYIVGERTTLIQPKHTLIQPKSSSNGLQKEISGSTVLEAVSADLPTLPTPPPLPPPLPPPPPLKSAPPPVTPPAPAMTVDIPTESIESVLQELVDKPIGIDSAVLISSEGTSLTLPIGIAQDSSLIISGIMLYLIKSSQEELNWQEIQQVSVKGQDGHLILTTCNSETYLLIKAHKAIAGLLQGEIQRTIKKINTLMNIETEPMQQPFTFSSPSPTPVSSSPAQENPYEFPAEIFYDPDEEVRYRGRRTT